MDSPKLWDALRAQGIDADEPEVRTAVRACLRSLDAVQARADEHAARRCREAVHAALAYELRHPPTGDMTSFEDEFNEEDG